MSEPFLQELDWPLAHSVGVKVSLWREDLNHPGMSGNKLYKLKYHLNQARETGANQLVSMGGPWSNHLHAVAFAARECQIQSRGIIRGYHNQLSESLIDMLKSQMQLMFVSKQIFREIRAIGLNHPVISDLGSDIYFIPEGGSCREILPSFNRLAKTMEAAGCGEHLVVPVGTGGTLAGLVANLTRVSHVYGYQAVADGDVTRQRIEYFLAGSSKVMWSLWGGQTRRGFGHRSSILNDTIAMCDKYFGAPLDPVYTGPAFVALTGLLLSRKFQAGSSVTILHSGGGQGRRSLQGGDDYWMKQLFTGNLNHAEFCNKVQSGCVRLPQLAETG